MIKTSLEQGFIPSMRAGKIGIDSHRKLKLGAQNKSERRPTPLGCDLLPLCNHEPRGNQPTVIGTREER
jgi:hypothetical protein